MATALHRCGALSLPSVSISNFSMKTPKIAVISSPNPAFSSTPPSSSHVSIENKSSIKLCNSTIKRSLLQGLQTKWISLNTSKTELSLTLTFPTGQNFLWKKTGPNQYTGVVKSHLISLKHLENDDVAYFIHKTHSEIEAKADLFDFLNLSISLTDMWKDFSTSDSRFSEISVFMRGIRVLRQDPLECLLQFLCSSNNNIGRITQMVGFLSSLGDHLGNVEGFDFYRFPSLDRLALVKENEFRAAGFGYRAKYIVGTVEALRSKPGGGANWLFSLRGLELHEVIEALCTLPGVGPKVAACIALFSLDQHHAIPVDTHVWQLATRYLTPQLAGARLTPKLFSQVAEAFINKFGKYAGWAQTVLFVSELPHQKMILPPHLWSVKERESENKARKVRKESYKTRLEAMVPEEAL